MKTSMYLENNNTANWSYSANLDMTSILCDNHFQNGAESLPLSPKKLHISGCIGHRNLKLVFTYLVIKVINSGERSLIV